VDWSREPRGAREAAVRAAYLNRCLAEGSLGWIELLCLAMDRRRVPADLAAGAAEAERLLAERVAARERERLDRARADADDVKREGG
jgi:hypothetical protein